VAPAHTLKSKHLIYFEEYMKAKSVPSSGYTRYGKERPLAKDRCLSACLKFQLRTLNRLPPQTKGKH
jgi:hypothetical protein